MRLLLLHPEVAARSCDDCARWMFDDKPGVFGLPMIDKSTDEPFARPANAPTPCKWCPKIPSGAAKVRASAIELDERNVSAVLHYRECRAVLTFPDDWIVRRNAAAIRAVEDQAERMRQDRMALAFMGAGR